MATRLKKNKKPGKGGKIALKVFVAALLIVLITIAAGMINASVVRIRRAEVRLTDLPPAFDGVTVLYASDIDLFGLNTPRRSGELFDRLQSLKPDILLLGGDYTSASLLEILNRSGEKGANSDISRKARTDFFHYIASFEAPLGKYAIAAPEDQDRQDLANTLSSADVNPLFNRRAELRRGGDVLYLAGICEESANLNSAGRVFDRGDCVLAVAYSPAVLPVLLTGEAGDGGAWADLVLSGHTHGGQIRLFGRSVLPLAREELRRLSGWGYENGLPVLVTQGVGCEGVNLRLGTAPEIWLITLRRAQP